MSDETDFISAVPVLASLDIRRSVDFFAARLGFTINYVSQGTYGIVERGGVHLHFWACADRKIAEATGCRISVRNIAALYRHCVAEAIVHPNAALNLTPWGNQEFAIVDPDGNLVTFFEAADKNDVFQIA